MTLGIILAAGRGRRMDILTRDTPKCLVNFRGRPLLEWQIAALQESGVQRIALVTGYLATQLEGFNLPTFHNEKWEQTNMVKSLTCAHSWLASHTCIISYSDIFFSSSSVLALCETDADIAIAYDPNWRKQWERRFSDPLIDAETFRISSDGTILDIGGRPQSVEEIQGQFMGLIRTTPKGWEQLMVRCDSLSAFEKDRIDTTGLLRRMILAGDTKIAGIPIDDEWYEFDAVSDLQNIQ